MPHTLPCKAYQIIAVLLACMVVVVVIACQLHTLLGDEQATPTDHRSTSSTPSTVELSCQAAALPQIMFFALLFGVLFHITPLVLQHTLLASPLFRPPKNAAR